MPKNTTPNLRLNQTLRISSTAICLLVFTIGLAASIGWAFNISSLKNIFPNLPIIAPNTSFALMLSAISLWILQEKRSQNKIRFLAYSIAIFIGVIGILTFIEYVAGIDLKIDNLIFKNAFSANGLPVRMSPQSSINFFIISLSFLLINFKTKKNKQPSQYLILIVGLVSLFSFFGFVNNLPSFYTISPYKGMAAHTAIAFGLLFIGIFISRPNTGLMKIFSNSGISGFVARRLFITLFFLMANDVLAMAGHAANFYGHETEAIMHAFLIIVAFIYLMFIGFGSLDKIQSIEEVDRAKSEFVSFVSHQLHTPLTAIKWSADAMLHDSSPLNEKQKEYLSNIHHSADRTINLANAFLNVSKIEQGGFSIENQLINPVDMANDILQELHQEIQKKELSIIREYENNLTALKIDPKLFRIVLQNLISNAIKYTPSHGRITIFLARKNNKIEISVKDSGLGIPAKQQEKVFTKLFRGENIKNETEGSGLGLYMIKTLLEKANGKIWFKSKPNQGTEFVADIPIG